MKVQNIEMTDWESATTGLLIDENDDWLLMRFIPYDYMLDGYKLICKKFIKKRSSPPDLAIVKRVLDLRQSAMQAPMGFTFGSVEKMLQWCEDRYGVFEFQESEQELFYGRINKIKGGELYIDMVNAFGQLETEFPETFQLDHIRIITFDTDYFNAIRLLMEYEMPPEDGQPSSDD